MPKKKNEYQKLAGKLISAVQKEWGKTLGEENAEFSEKVLDAAHDLLNAGTSENARGLLGVRSVRQYLGDVWVQGRPELKPAVDSLDDLINKECPVIENSVSSNPLCISKKRR